VNPLRVGYGRRIAGQRGGEVDHALPVSVDGHFFDERRKEVPNRLWVFRFQVGSDVESVGYDELRAVEEFQLVTHDCIDFLQLCVHFLQLGLTFSHFGVESWVSAVFLNGLHQVINSLVEALHILLDIRPFRLLF